MPLQAGAPTLPAACSMPPKQRSEWRTRTLKCMTFLDRGMMKPVLLLLAALVAAFTAPAGAQSTSGAGRVVVVPLIAQTSTFQSDVTVLNPNGNSITVAVKSYDANNLATA